jgi:hypothetical protein
MVATLALFPAARAAAAEPNAALKYWLAFANMNYDKDQEKIIEDWNKVPLDAKTDKLLDNARVFLLQMHRGAQIEHCDWGLDYSDGVSMLLPHLGKARNLTRVAALDIRRELVRGNGPGAVQTGLDALTMARHTNSDFTLISILVRIVNEATIFEALAAGLPKLDAASLTKLAAFLDAPRGGGTVPESIKGEKEFMARWLIRKLQEAEEKKAGSYKEVLHAVLVPSEAPEDKARTQRVLEAGDTYEKAIKLLENLMPVYDELVRIYSLPAKEFDSQYPAYAEKAKAANPAAELLMPALEKVAASERRNQTQRALFRAAIKIVQGGLDKVKETMDPFGDGPFEYRAIDGGFELKSKFKFKDQPVTLTVGPAK